MIGGDSKVSSSIAWSLGFWMSLFEIDASTVAAPLGVMLTPPPAIVAEPSVLDIRIDPDATPISSYRRRLKEGKEYARPGTVYELLPWKRSPEPAA